MTSISDISKHTCIHVSIHTHEYKYSASTSMQMCLASTHTSLGEYSHSWPAIALSSPSFTIGNNILSLLVLALLLQLLALLDTGTQSSPNLAWMLTYTRAWSMQILEGVALFSGPWWACHLLKTLISIHLYNMGCLSLPLFSNTTFKYISIVYELVYTPPTLCLNEIHAFLALAHQFLS